jgi:hypothetical protein
VHGVRNEKHAFQHFLSNACSYVSITVIRKLEIKVEIRVRTPYNLPNINLYPKKIDLISAIMSNRIQII